METDASVKGLGGVLSQYQSDGVLHPVAFASCSLSPAEKNYGVTDLETLAVVWAMQHYLAYLYRHNVMVITAIQQLRQYWELLVRVANMLDGG